MRYTNDEIIKRSKKKDIRRRIIKALLYIIIIPIILYNIALIYISIANQNEIPEFLKVKTFIIVSGSMEPELSEGDIIIVKKCEENDLKENDIISYRTGQSEITHRIVQIETTGKGKRYITKGDNNIIVDNEPVKYENIEGKYIGKISYLGKVILFFNNKLLLIVLIILIYTADSKKRKKWYERKEKRERYEREMRQ